MKELRRTDLVYPELSYTVVGILFEVYKQIGSGLLEKHYQKAVATELKRSGLTFKEQVSLPLIYKDQTIGRYFLDFLIEDRIVLEIKKDKLFARKNIEQVLNYLKTYKLQLGILANFTTEGLKYKRIVNIK